MGTFILLGILLIVIVQAFIVLFIINRMVEAYKRRGVDKEYDAQKEKFNRQANLSRKSVDIVETTLKTSKHPTVVIPVKEQV